LVVAVAVLVEGHHVGVRNLSAGPTGQRVDAGGVAATVEGVIGVQGAAAGVLEDPEGGVTGIEGGAPLDLQVGVERLSVAGRHRSQGLALDRLAARVDAVGDAVVGAVPGDRVERDRGGAGPTEPSTPDLLSDRRRTG